MSKVVALIGRVQKGAREQLREEKSGDRGVFTRGLQEKGVETVESVI
jgi:hypothetical protein